LGLRTLGFSGWLVVLVLVVLALSLISLSVGTYRGLSLPKVVKGLLKGGLSRADLSILDRRAARTVAALIAGLGLASSGIGLQYVLRNPLAEPYLLGISAGAALGVLVSLAFGYYMNPVALHATALALGLAGFSVVIATSAFTGLSPLSVIIAGIAVSYAISSINIVLTMLLGPKVHGALAWLYGTVAYVLWDEVTYSAPVVIVAVAWLLLRARAVGTLILGEEVAESLGVRVKRLRVEVVIASALATSSVVAFAGPIGFIGLAAPWIARLLVGSDFRASYITSLAVGPALVVGSDIGARLVMPIESAPLTAITALIGAPVLIYLLVRRSSWGG